MVAGGVWPAPSRKTRSSSLRAGRRIGAGPLILEPFWVILLKVYWKLKIKRAIRISQIFFETPNLPKFRLSDKILYSYEELLRALFPPLDWLLNILDDKVTEKIMRQ